MLIKVAGAPTLETRLLFYWETVDRRTGGTGPSELGSADINGGGHLRMFSIEIFMVAEARVPLLPFLLSPLIFLHTPKARSVAVAGNQQKLEGFSR